MDWTRRLALLAAVSALTLSISSSPVQAGTYDGTSGTVDCSGGGTFTISSKVVYRSESCHGLAVIPEGVWGIDDHAFSNASQLNSVTIPSTVTSIGFQAFKNVGNLVSVRFLGNANKWGFYSPNFEGAPAGAVVYISSCATGFASVGEQWFGLTVQIGVYCLTFDAGGGRASTTTGFLAGGSVLAPIPPTKNCIFDGWSATHDGLKVDFPYSPGVLSDTTLHARWKKCSYRVSVIAGSKPAIPSSTYVFGESIADPGVPHSRNGRYFAGWSETGHSPAITFPYSPEIEGNVILRGIWNRSVRARAITKPTVMGNAKVNHSLTANSGVWSGTPAPVISYQWYSCTAKVTSVKVKIPSTCKKISGATKSTLALTKKYKGKHIAVAVTGKSSGSPSMKLLSKTTARVK